MSEKAASPRRSVLDLAPLELDCMNTLWPLGEGTVREIRDGLAARRPRAYTTIMTIMDRLARKGIVERRKSGRAYIYRPNLSAQDARAQALGQVVENFFGGSKDALMAQLRTSLPPARPLASAAAVSGAPTKPYFASPTSAPPARPAWNAGEPRRVPQPRVPRAPAKEAHDEEERIDDTLL
ncbi:MAG: BlaI/MecI/CopY family transcriptional regulator, partial [Candidatus Acidiferrales bacterium]